LVLFVKSRDLGFSEFLDPAGLTIWREIAWSEIPLRVIGWSRTLVDSPSPERGLKIVKRNELHDVQTLVARTTIERLDVPDFDAFTGSNEAEFHVAFQALSNALRGCRASDLRQRDRAIQLSDSGKDAKLLPSEQLIVHEIAATALAQRARHAHLAALQAHLLASSDAGTQPQPVKLVESPTAFPVKRPASRTQHHVDPLVAEPQRRMGNPASS